MKTLSIILLALLTINTAKAQEGRTSLQAFENLVGGTWKGEGAWGDGTPFNQHITFEWGLSGKMIKAKTYGNVSREGNEFGLRNEGVRIWSEEASAVKFWEFDIFGGITEGTVDTDDGDIYYHYLYDVGQGPNELTDAWIYRDEIPINILLGYFKTGNGSRSIFQLRWKETNS